MKTCCPGIQATASLASSSLRDKVESPRAPARELTQILILFWPSPSPCTVTVDHLRVNKLEHQFPTADRLLLARSLSHGCSLLLLPWSVRTEGP